MKQASLKRLLTEELNFRDVLEKDGEQSRGCQGLEDGLTTKANGEFGGDGAVPTLTVVVVVFAEIYTTMQRFPWNLTEAYTKTKPDKMASK